MKKLIALLCAGVLTMSMAMTAFAAESVKADVVTGVESTVADDGEEVEVKTQPIEKDHHEEVVDDMLEKVSTEAGMKEQLGDAYVEGMRPVSVREVVVVDENGNEVHDDVAKAEIKWPIKIVFKVKGVTAKSKVALLHYDDNRKTWEVVPSVAGEGTITGTFHSLSPVMFIVDNETADAMGDDVMIDDKPATDDKDDEAVKTGDNNAALLYGVIMVVAVVIVGGVVVSKKRA